MLSRIKKRLLHYQADPKTLWRRYLFALGIIFAFVVGSHSVFLSATEMAKEDATVINIAGQQRMLSQSILHLAGRYLEDGRSDQTAKRLADAIDRFDDTHRALTGGGGSTLVSARTMDRLRPILFEPMGNSVSIDDQVRTFIVQARSLQTADDANAHDTLASLDAMGSTTLLKGLNRAVALFSDGAPKRAELLTQLHWVTLAVAIVVLLMEAAFIFWPAHVAARSALQELEHNSTKLRASQAELERALEEAENSRIVAEQSDRQKSLFLANMSHELRTPLNAIIGFSSMMHNEVFGPIGADKYLEYSADIEHSGAYLLALIGDLIDMSRIESGDLKPAYDTVLIDDLTGLIQRTARGWEAAKKREIVIDDSAAPEFIVADKRRMQQILLNLLSNAVNFTPEGARISVTLARTRGNGLKMVVEDNGPGFNIGEMEHLTKPFHRGDDPFVRDKEGTGLGLSLVSAFVKMHNGEMALSNCEPNGACVTLSLPAGVAGETMRSVKAAA